MSVVYANCTTHVTEAIMIVEGDAWDANDPLVTARPHLFNAAPPQVHSSDASFTAQSASRAKPVETATASPGEKRAIK